MIRQKFPLKRFPQLTLEPIEPQPEAQPMLSENLLLYLVEGVNNDVIISSLISAGHLFLQQPTHPTFPSLIRLSACMASCYAEPNQPPLPDMVQRKQYTWRFFSELIFFVDFSGYCLCGARATRVVPRPNYWSLRGWFMQSPVCGLRWLHDDWKE